MKKIYKFKHSSKDEYGVIYKLSYGRDRSEIENLQNQINTTSITPKLSLEISLTFATNIGSGPIRFLDTLRWDLGKPSAYVFLVSERLKTEIEQFRLPAHTYYDVVVKSEGKSVRYFLLHIYYSNKVELNFEKTPFKKFDLYTNQPIDGKEIFFSNHQEFYTENSSAVKSETYFESNKYVYQKSYDIFWGNPFTIALQENVKTIFEKLNFSGFTIGEFQDYQIAFSNPT